MIKAYLTKILLNKFRANNPNKGCSCMVCNSLSKHGFTCARWTIEQNATWWVDTYLFVQFVMSQR
ncbi:hypothetical protein Hanom_Chr08g00751691 [Helianthus anomalus]